MSRELYNLPPAGVNLPARYKKTINSRRLFIEGAQAGLDGVPITPEYDSRLFKQQGQAAREAYQDGYSEGTKARLLKRSLRSKSP